MSRRRKHKWHGMYIGVANKKSSRRVMPVAKYIANVREKSSLGSLPHSPPPAPNATEGSQNKVSIRVSATPQCQIMRAPIFVLFTRRESLDEIYLSLFHPLFPNFKM